MDNGIYSVNFLSGHGNAGGGLVVIKGDSVNGGDDGYIYTGNLVAEAGERIAGRLKVKRWNPSAQSIFGPIAEFELEISGSASGRSLQASGQVVGRPGQAISIRGNYVGPAV